jgi:hypothetical protein
MLFKIGNQLEYRVVEVSAGGPRRVYAGWYLSESEHAGRQPGVKA